MPRSYGDRPSGPLTMRRSFVTPEGVDLQLDLYVDSLTVGA